MAVNDTGQFLRWSLCLDGLVETALNLHISAVGDLKVLPLEDAVCESEQLRSERRVRIITASLRSDDQIDHILVYSSNIVDVEIHQCCRWERDLLCLSRFPPFVHNIVKTQHEFILVLSYSDRYCSQ